MDQNRKQKWKQFGLFALRSADIYLFFAIISALIYALMTLNNYDNRAQAAYLPATPLHALCLIFCLLLYYSLMRTNAVCSRTLCEQFLSGWDRSAQPGVVRRFQFTLRSPAYRADLLVHTLFLLIFPSAFGFTPLKNLLGIHGNHGIVFLIMAPSLALLGLLARVSALTAWMVAWNKKAGTPRPENNLARKLLLRCFLTGALFLLTAAISPLGIRMLYALFTILRLIDLRILIPAIPGVWLLWHLIRFSVAAAKRHRFFRHLRVFCRKNGYELSRVKKGYRSLLFPCEQPNFTISKGEERFVCRLISSPGRHSPLLFREEGTVTCTHTLRLFSLNLFHYDFTYDYRFEGEGRKVLILLPAPIEVFVSGYGVTQPAYPGSRTAEYPIYGATDLLHALERGTVGR